LFAQTLSLSTPKASIRLKSNTTINSCSIASEQIVTPPDGGEIFSRATSNVSVENVRFTGGGHHLLFNGVTNFRVANTRHESITVPTGGAIVIFSSDRGEILSPVIGNFTEPKGSGQVRMIGISNSHSVSVHNPVIRDIDATTAAGCAGVAFAGTTSSSLDGGTITNLNNCDGVLTEAIEMTPASNIEISGTVTSDLNPGAGAGTHTGNGEGFDIFNSKDIRLTNITSRGNGRFEGNGQPGIEICNSINVVVENCECNDNGLEGIRIDGALDVKILGSRTNRNGSAGIIVEPVFGNVRATQYSTDVAWAPGRANQHFASIWPANTKIIIGHTPYTIASLESRSKLTLTNNFMDATGIYPSDVNSYAEIEGGESNDNGQRGGKDGSREGIYFASDGTSGPLLGRVSRLMATNTTSSKTQTYGVRIENSGRIIAEGNVVKGNALGGIRDSPGKSSIH
jgi:Right handed beta helix region